VAQRVLRIRTPVILGGNGYVELAGIIISKPPILGIRVGAVPNGYSRVEDII